MLVYIAFNSVGGEVSVKLEQLTAKLCYPTLRGEQIHCKANTDMHIAHYYMKYIEYTIKANTLHTIALCVFVCILTALA